MKEVLCRAKMIDSNVWVYGYYIKYETRQPSPIGDKLSEDEILHLIANSSFADWNMPRHLTFHKIKPETVGQSTGKEDINRKLVFDGDRLKHEGFWPMRVLGIRVVPDDDVQRANCIPSKCKGIDEFDFSEWEVFGNIHDKDPA